MYLDATRSDWSLINLAMANMDIDIIATSRRKVYNSFVRSTILIARETCPPNFTDMHCLQRNDRAMIRGMCGVTTKDQVSSQQGAISLE